MKIKNRNIPILINLLFLSFFFIACRDTQDQSGTSFSSETGQANNGNPVSFSFALPSLI